ncbi:MAG: hypothetical protein RR692_05725, partial [Raoultibacter sp.]
MQVSGDHPFVDNAVITIHNTAPALDPASTVKCWVEVHHARMMMLMSFKFDVRLQPARRARYNRKS